MIFSTEFANNVNGALGIDVSKETLDSLRIKLENFLEDSIDKISEKIGHGLSDQDIVIPMEHNNALYKARTLYNEFMETQFN